MLIADLEVRHTRRSSPTRRVALGESLLPVEPSPGPGPLLLAGVVATFATLLSDDMREEVDLLIDDLMHLRPITQPRLRFRFQVDTVGLDRSHHRLVQDGSHRLLQVDQKGFEHPLPQVLAACYAASELPYRSQRATYHLLRRATRWEGGDSTELMSWLAGDSSWSARSVNVSQEEWALGVFGFLAGEDPSRADILRRYRLLLRDAHPDSGGEADEAAKRIHELTDAKKVLLVRGDDQPSA